MTSLTAKANTGSGTDKLAVKVINTDENAAVVFPYLGTAEISDANPMPVSDAGGSLTIDGSVAVTGTVAVTDNSGSLTVDDGGSSLTIDGTVAATQSGTWNVGTVTTVTNVVHVDDNASTLSVDDGGGSLTIDGTVAVSGTVAVTDNSGSLTVDAPVGTPVFVRLSDGSAAITTLPVSLASVPSHAVTNAGTFAVQDSEKVADNAAFTDGTTKVLPAGFIFDEVAGTALTENNAAAARIDSKRAQVLVIEDATTRGQRLAVNASGAASANVTHLGGTAVDMNSGNKSAGTLRVVLATDQPSLTNSLPVSISGNQAVNLAQINGNTIATGSGASSTGTPRVILASDSPGAGSVMVQCVATYTRPANTTAYSVGDAYSNSTSAPAVLSFTGAAKASGKGGVIKKMIVTDSNGVSTAIQGELWLYRSSPTATNDNSAFTNSDSDALLVECVIPFTTELKGANNTTASVACEEAFVCSGGTTLYGQVRLLNAYTPASAETLSFSLNIDQRD